MSLLDPRRLAAFILGTLVLGFGVPSAAAQDKDTPAKMAADKATKRQAEFQEKLATGSDLRKRFRIDGFEVNKEGQVEVHGVFLQPGYEKGSVVGGQGKKDEEKIDQDKKVEAEFEALQNDLVGFLETEIKVAGVKYSVSDAGVTRLGGLDHPAVALQKAANDAGGMKDFRARVSEADQIELDGARFNEKGDLVLFGKRGAGDATRDWLKEAARKTLATNKAAKKKDGVFKEPDLQGVKAVEWGLTARKLQGVFAASGNRILERVRVDRIYLAHDRKEKDAITRWTRLKLHFTGVALEVPGKVVTEEEIVKKCQELWPARLGVGAGPNELQFAPFGDTFFAPGVPEPYKELQEIVSGQQTLDGVRVDFGAKFGPDGKLFLAGLRPRRSETKSVNAKATDPIELGVEESYRKAVDQLSRRTDTTGPEYAKLADGPGASTANMEEADTRRMLSELRKWTTKAIWFKLTPGSFADLREEKVPSEVIEKLKALENKQYGTRDEMGRDVSRVFNLIELERYEELVLNTAEKRMSDVRLSRLYFDKDGGLKLVCTAPTAEAVDTVRAKLRATSPEFIRVAPKKDPAKEEKTDPKKEEKKDFNKQEKTDPKKDPAKEEKKDPTKDNPAVRLPGSPSVTRIVAYPAARVEDPPTGVMPPTPDIVETPLVPSLTAELRKRMLEDDTRNRWKAVLIEQGYFDDKTNRYTILGVVDNPGQNVQLAELLDSLKSDPKWKVYFEVPPAPPALEVIPMSKLVTRVQRVTPGYEVLDRIRVIDADYRLDRTSKSVLVFKAHIVGRPDRFAERTLTELIKADAAYFGQRLPKGRLVEFEPIPEPIPPSQSYEIHFTNGYAAYNLARVAGSSLIPRLFLLKKARDWLDVGLLHGPERSSLWFLSAYWYYVTGDLELARRDLYRVVGIEREFVFDGGWERRNRYVVAKDVQGPMRSEVERLWLQCWKEVNDGAKPLTIVEWFKLTPRSFAELQSEMVPDVVLVKLDPLKGKAFSRRDLVEELSGVLTADELTRFKNLILDHATSVPAR